MRKRPSDAPARPADSPAPGAAPLIADEAIPALLRVFGEREFREAERDCLYCLSYGMAVAIEHTRRDRESRRDPLTGLLNRREFDRLLREHAIRWRRHTTPFSLLWIDVDRFKELNDVHGHALGDEVLRNLSQLLRDRLRETDFAFRCGGEEFACLLPDTRQGEAVILADDLRRRFRSLRHEKPDTGSEAVTATVSLGVAEYAGELPDAFVDRADAAMYEAKRRGRDRICEAPAKKNGPGAHASAPGRYEPN